MEIAKIFAAAVNAGGISKALKILKIDEAIIKQAIEKKKFVIESKAYDIVIDYKPKINYLILYLCEKKSSKKFLKTLRPDVLEFKSLVVYIGYIRLFEKTFDVRLGAYGHTSSELGDALIGRIVPETKTKSIVKKKIAKTKKK